MNLQNNLKAINSVIEKLNHEFGKSFNTDYQIIDMMYFKEPNIFAFELNHTKYTGCEYKFDNIVIINLPFIWRIQKD